MSLAADALQPFIIKGLFALCGRVDHVYLADVITSQYRTGYDLDFDDSAQRIKLDFRDGEYIAAAVGGDACRLASAAFVTLPSIQLELQERNSIAWSMVKLYYSAFYAGNALLRLLGQSCSYLDSTHVNRLRQLSAAAGNIPTFAINAGLYHCVLTPAQTGISFTQARGSLGGTHEAFWKIFMDYIRSINEQVLSGFLIPRDAHSMFIKLSAFEAILDSARHSSWLSSVRNEIQYRHGAGVWPPLKIKKQDRERLPGLAAQWLRDPMDIELDFAIRGKLEGFVVACAFTVAFCRATLARISERASVGAKSFARHPLAMHER
jgi:hypothetical protein